ncbi:MAG: bifunctional folylpolyglutamate synthase/dihydrofolate synthase [Winogradskyella sp.]|uniref:bifunctional folylpolyglutamate synthase/dihydrofolate synthase n=1 Tax=Winogradskyella sp. TaxID=1883156 RepID=UPI0018545C39|nr:folylpolyglutamate synthase/dihydrofolate synthase family protein [Winogradskyella sp.]MBT8246051.1 bifunctional folylpolyglutamate synthase/dihydrofolate synthase [Winogradskyella sp.]NNK22223.1 bifunctional folylpolyglutamate synthase/dihydrofolate synthase [Winogradskyella sp.]
MSYQETIDWLFNQLPMYQNQGKSAYKEDLSNTILLAKYLGNPENKFKSIHVGGTNGKGSCSHMLASILQEAGYKVGLYTSPHLKDYRERIKINGKEISKQFVIEFVKKHKSFFEQNSLSFFEMTVGLAFDYFAKQKVDMVITEVGLGGRLDSTNIILPELSVITNIGFDHVQFLGNTRPKIAFEKAGIIKSNVPVVIGETHEETKPVFDSKATETNSNIFYADHIVSEVFESDLKGSYQQNNIKTVIQSVKVLRGKGFKISQNDLKAGLNKVVKNTGLMGRWQVLGESPKIICDTAHNVEGLSYVMRQLQQESNGQLHIIFGVVNDKNLNDILNVLPEKAMYYLCKPNIQRGLDVYTLSELFIQKGFESQTCNSVKDAFTKAKSKAEKEDVIYIGGSTFVVAEIL